MIDKIINHFDLIFSGLSFLLLIPSLLLFGLGVGKNFGVVSGVLFALTFVSMLIYGARKLQ